MNRGESSAASRRMGRGTGGGWRWGPTILGGMGRNGMDSVPHLGRLAAVLLPASSSYLEGYGGYSIPLPKCLSLYIYMGGLMGMTHEA